MPYRLSYVGNSLCKVLHRYRFRVLPDPTDVALAIGDTVHMALRSAASRVRKRVGLRAKKRTDGDQQEQPPRPDDKTERALQPQPPRGASDKSSASRQLTWLLSTLDSFPGSHANGPEPWRKRLQNK